MNVWLREECVNFAVCVSLNGWLSRSGCESRWVCSLWLHVERCCMKDCLNPPVVARLEKKGNEKRF